MSHIPPPNSTTASPYRFNTSNQQPTQPETVPSFHALLSSLDPYAHQPSDEVAKKLTNCMNTLQRISASLKCPETGRTLWDKCFQLLRNPSMLTMENFKATLNPFEDDLFKIISFGNGILLNMQTLPYQISSNHTPYTAFSSHHALAQIYSNCLARQASSHVQPPTATAYSPIYAYLAPQPTTLPAPLYWVPDTPSQTVPLYSLNMLLSLPRDVLSTLHKDALLNLLRSKPDSWMTDNQLQMILQTADWLDEAKKELLSILCKNPNCFYSNGTQMMSKIPYNLILAIIETQTGH